MILIADSGSTKTDWVLINDSKESFSTIGFNPFYRSSEFIIAEISKNNDLLNVSNSISQMYFYGAGCSSESRKNIVIEALQHIFKQAKIVVDHDLMACAHALYRGKPIIANILGTGTNSCYFDGKELSQAKPSLGYVLGDEASGAYFGKALITNYLYKELPNELKVAFDTEFNLTKDQLLERIYMEPGANTYLASFTSFIGKHKDHPFFQNMLQNGFLHFFKTHICCYEHYKIIEIGFIGSIAFHFQDELHKVAESLKINISTIIKTPMDGLIEYHQFNG